MSGEEHYTHSQLFTVRVWQPDTADEHTEWRGKLCHIPSGEIRYFRGWAALIPLMLDMLRRHTPPAAAESPAATGEG